MVLVGSILVLKKSVDAFLLAFEGWASEAASAVAKDAKRHERESPAAKSLNLDVFIEHLWFCF